jgi:PAS domain S-box-containing protein
MTAKPWKSPKYKFFSIGQFLEASVTRLTGMTAATSTAARKYFERLYNLIASYEEIVLDYDGSILSWNERFALLEGYSEQEIIGQHLNLFFTPRERQNKVVENLITKASVAGTAVHFGQLVRKDGTLYPGSLKIVRVRSKGKILGFVAVCRRAKTVTENKWQFAPQSREQRPAL